MLESQSRGLKTREIA